MRFILALTVGFGGLLTFCVGEGRAQPNTVLDQLKGANPQDYLVGPTQGRRKSEDTRNMSTAPSTAPVTPADSVNRSREISPSERQDLLQNRTRETPLDWSDGRDRN